MKSLTIVLAGKDYEIEQLTLRQLRDLSIGVVVPDSPDPQVNVGRIFDRSVTIVAAALNGVTADDLYNMPVTRRELDEASNAVLTFSGLLPPVLPLSALREQLAALQAQIAEREKEEGDEPGKP